MPKVLASWNQCAVFPALWFSSLIIHSAEIKCPRSSSSNRDQTLTSAGKSLQLLRGLGCVPHNKRLYAQKPGLSEGALVTQTRGHLFIGSGIR